jgi:hypothetical protein
VRHVVDGRLFPAHVTDVPERDAAVLLCTILRAVANAFVSGTEGNAKNKIDERAW